jgi:hypothetical protein
LVYRAREKEEVVANMIKWTQLTPVEGRVFDWDRIFIIPRELGGLDIFYGDEFCAVDDLSVQEFMDKLKLCELQDISKLSTLEVEALIASILKENPPNV